MKLAYIDTSYLIAIVFGERASSSLRKKLLKFDRLLSSNLLEAEFLSTLRRESVDIKIVQETLEPISWIYPNQTLTNEFNKILKIDYLRGADLWHLACALYIGSPKRMSFLTLDRKQKLVARKLGFKV